LHQPQSDQLLQRVGNDVRVLDVDHEADVGELLFARPVIDVMQQQHVERSEVLQAGGRHAAHDPAHESVGHQDQAELELRQFLAARRHQVCRRDEQARHDGLQRVRCRLSTAAAARAPGRGWRRLRGRNRTRTVRGHLAGAGGSSHAESLGDVGAAA
jgi:hypothetical protein